MRALILVDIQNDFMPGGALPVPDGHAVVPIANELAARFDLVVATQDWHPADHGSFASNREGHEPGEVVKLEGLEQILWPDHCVQGTDGARFVPQLDTDSIDHVFQKGTDPTIDSYSGFFDNGRRKATGLASFLRERDIDTVYVLGVATDYCVKWTALDAAAEGFITHVVADGCRGVNINEGDVELAFSQMREAGIDVVGSGDVP
jgi:nicotinamidase/pyrazinamidase